MRATIALATLLTWCAFGCSDEPTKPPDDPYLPQTSPENVLENVQTSYENRDIDAYCEQLAYDFIFEFDPGSPEIPPDVILHFDEDSTATRNLFKGENLSDPAEKVVDINLSFTSGNSVPVTVPTREGERLITVRNVYLEVVQQGSVDGPVTLGVRGDQADFYFRRGRTAADSTSSNWYIVRWRDRTLCGVTDLSDVLARGRSRRASVVKCVSCECVSWGRIKVIYKA